MIVQFARTKLLFEPRLFVDLEKRLTDLSHPDRCCARSRWRTPIGRLEDEVAIDELLSLLHLALEDAPQIGLLTNDAA